MVRRREYIVNKTLREVFTTHQKKTYLEALETNNEEVLDLLCRCHLKIKCPVCGGFIKIHCPVCEIREMRKEVQ